MIRKYKGQAIATTLCLLLQLALGAVFYERIPDPLGGGKRWMRSACRSSCWRRTGWCC